MSVGGRGPVPGVLAAVAASEHPLVRLLRKPGAACDPVRDAALELGIANTFTDASSQHAARERRVNESRHFKELLLRPVDDVEEILVPPSAA